MPLARPTRLLTAWMAGFALLFAALAPTLAQAFGPRYGASWVEVCTAQGAAWVDTAAVSGHDDTTTPHLFEHCPYCTWQAHAPALPPAPSASLLPIEGAGAVPLAFLAAPRSVHAWVSAQPRAPPSVS